MCKTINFINFFNKKNNNLISTLKKNFIFLLFGFLIFETVCTNLYFALFISNSSEKSIDLEQISNDKNMSFFLFQLPSDKSQFSFKIFGNGGIGEGSLEKFCDQKKFCKLPLIFGGKQTVKIFKASKVIFSKQINSGENRFFCFDGDSWNRRICRFRDICFENNDKNLTFLSPYKITTDSPFLVLGGRPPPYDKKRDRIYSIDVKVDTDKTIPGNRIIHNETTIYVSTYYNMQMLFHSLFDFTLPLFYTFTHIPDLKEKLQRVAIPNDADFPMNKKFVQAFVESFGRIKRSHCYKDIVIGMTKVKDLETGTLYEFPYNFTYQYHPYVLKKFEIIKNESEISELIPKKPVILFSGRKTSKRSLMNYDEIFERMKKEFSTKFDIEKIFYEEHDMATQIEKTYKSSIMIGIHGSGLSHVCWMRPGTVMIEIFPYKFDCRDWYQRTTNVSAVKYFKYVPQDEEESPGASQSVKNCWSKTPKCDGPCLDLLRDQNVSVNIDRFIELMRNAINTFQSL